MPAKNAVKSAATKAKAPKNGTEDKSQTVFLHIPVDQRIPSGLNGLAELDAANQRQVVEGLIHARRRARVLSVSHTAGARQSAERGRIARTLLRAPRCRLGRPYNTPGRIVFLSSA